MLFFQQLSELITLLLCIDNYIIHFCLEFFMVLFQITQLLFKTSLYIFKLLWFKITLSQHAISFQNDG